MLLNLVDHARMTTYCSLVLCKLFLRVHDEATLIAFGRVGIHRATCRVMASLSLFEGRRHQPPEQLIHSHRDKRRLGTCHISSKRCRWPEWHHSRRWWWRRKVMWTTTSTQSLSLIKRFGLSLFLDYIKYELKKVVNLIRSILIVACALCAN